MDWGYMNFDLKGNLVSIQNTDSILPYSAKFNDNGSVKEVKFEYKDSYSSRNYNEYLLLTYNKDGDIINQTLGTFYKSNYDGAFSDSENYEYIFDIKGNWVEKKIKRVIVNHKYDNKYELDFNNAKTATEIKKRKIVYYKN